MQPFSTEALSLFRASLRTLQKVPRPARNKLKYNVREIFEIYRGPGIGEEKRKHIFEEGWHDIGVLREILKADPALVAEIFKPFESINEQAVMTAEQQRSDTDASMATENPVNDHQSFEAFDAQIPHADESTSIEREASMLPN